ncbi:hypothetical protein KXS07_06950 [Inquilinus limosus]|uniref:hypothetical protein n=1 Tax=Inquilinus limosus TaxID=171674 RepID=UPI003F13AC61
MIGLRSTGFLRKSPLLFVVAAAAALAVGIAWPRHPQPSELSLPPWPPGVEEPEEYAFGDAVRSREVHTWLPVFDDLEDRYGKPTYISLVLDANADLAALRNRFDEEMIDRRRWRALAQQSTRLGAWTRGYESADGRDVFMLIGLVPHPGETRVPLVVLTTIPIPGRE